MTSPGSRLEMSSTPVGGISGVVGSGSSWGCSWMKLLEVLIVDQQRAGMLRHLLGTDVFLEDFRREPGIDFLERLVGTVDYGPVFGCFRFFQDTADSIGMALVGKVRYCLDRLYLDHPVIFIQHWDELGNDAGVANLAKRS